MIIDKDTNLDKFWLINDGIYLTNNLYFGIGKSYYCDHGCQVCYIRDQLKEIKTRTNQLYNNDLEKMQRSWDELYSFFLFVALDEDPCYFKEYYPNEYQWYVRNAHKCSYGTTDNGIFRIRTLKEIKFKSMCEIALSLSFIEKVGPDKIIPALEDLMPIQKIKFIIDKNTEYPKEIMNWVRKKDLPIVIHPVEFVGRTVSEFDTIGFETVQEVNWVEGSYEDNFVKVHINNDVIVYYDSFYFSNNAYDVPYFKMDENGFDYRGFLSAMLEGKQRDYLIYADYVQDEYMKKYFLNTQKYKVNHNYNFIPNYMLSWDHQYFYRMIQLGWKMTKYGLLYPEDKVIPIVEIK